MLYAMETLRKPVCFFTENRLHGQSSIPALPRASIRQSTAETEEIKRAWSGTRMVGHVCHVARAAKNAFYSVQRGNIVLQATITAR